MFVGRAKNYRVPRNVSCLTNAQTMVSVRNVTNKDIPSWWGVLGQLLDVVCRAIVVIAEN
jgi:hypothetical protein